jgi:hypothetical protein
VQFSRIFPREIARMGRIAMRLKTPGKKIRGPNKFRKTETTRLLRATLDAGLNINRVECDPTTGKIVVFPGNGESMPGPQPSRLLRT